MITKGRRPNLRQRQSQFGPVDSHQRCEIKWSTGRLNDDSSTAYLAHDKKSVGGDSLLSIEQWDPYSSRFLVSCNKLGWTHVGLFEESHVSRHFRFFCKNSACVSSTPTDGQLSDLESSTTRGLRSRIVRVKRCNERNIRKVHEEMGRTHWNERWYCRFKPVRDNCEPFTIQVPCLSWRYNKRDQQGDRKVAGAASNTKKESTQNIAHGHDERNTHSSPEATKDEATLLRRVEEVMAFVTMFTPGCFVYSVLEVKKLGNSANVRMTQEDSGIDLHKHAS